MNIEGRPIEDVLDDEADHSTGERDRAVLMRLAAATIRKCRAAGFVTPEGEVRKVVRRVDVGRHPSDDLDPIVDVLDSGQVVFVCGAARKAGEGGQ